MKTFTAFVKDRETKEHKFITREYTNKKDFAHDLRRNGYSIKWLELAEVAEWVLSNTNAEPWDWRKGRKLFKNTEEGNNNGNIRPARENVYL